MGSMDRIQNGTASSREAVAPLQPHDPIDSWNKVWKEVLGNENIEDMRFREHCRSLLNTARDRHQKEHDPSGEHPKVFHVWRHPEIMFPRAQTISDVFDLEPRRRAIVVLAIAYHDIINDARLPGKEDINAMVVRNRGVENGQITKDQKGNEGRSGDEFRAALEAINAAARDAGEPEVFTAEEIDVGEQAIHATAPEVSFNAPFTEYKSEGGGENYYEIACRQNPALAAMIENLAGRVPPTTSGLLFTQPRLESLLEKNIYVPPEVFAVANADLEGASLARTSKEFLDEGDWECLELHHNWRDPERFGRLMHSDDEDAVRERDLVLNQENVGALAWLNTQVGFSVWQALRVEKEEYLLTRNGTNPNRISETQFKTLKDDFSPSVVNIQATVGRLDRVREDLSRIADEKERFRYIAKEMNFERGLLR